MPKICDSVEIIGWLEAFPQEEIKVRTCMCFGAMMHRYLLENHPEMFEGIDSNLYVEILQDVASMLFHNTQEQVLKPSVAMVLEAYEARKKEHCNSIQKSILHNTHKSA